MELLDLNDFEDVTDLEWEDLASAGMVSTTGAMRYRDYQSACIDSVEAGWAESLTQLAVLATGCGKTVIFSRIAEIESDRQAKTLILADTDELVEQAAAKLLASTGIRAGIEKASRVASMADNVVVASIQTLSGEKRLKTWRRDHFGLIVVDEADKSIAKSYDRVFDWFRVGEQNGSRLLGVTATADRGDNKSLGKRYARLAFEYGLLEACRDGWLVRPTVKTLPLEIDMRGLKPKGKDVSDVDVAERLRPFLCDIARVLVAEAGTRKTVVFLPSVETARIMAESIQQYGRTAVWVAGDKRRCPDRGYRIRQFVAGEFQFCINAQMLLRGFDDPAISCVCVLRPTKIRSLFVQAVGRGTRVLPGILDGLTDASARRAAIAASAKPDLLILDPLWLTDRLELIQPAQLITGDPHVLERVKREGDLIENEEAAERDLAASLMREAAKNRARKGRLFDPLEKAVSLGLDDIVNYRPGNAWEARPPTATQIDELMKLGVDPQGVRCFGLASKWIQKARQREKLGLCSFKQMSFLEKLGLDSPSMIAKDEASRITKNQMLYWTSHGKRGKNFSKRKN